MARCSVRPRVTVLSAETNAVGCGTNDAFGETIRPFREPMRTKSETPRRRGRGVIPAARGTVLEEQDNP